MKTQDHKLSEKTLMEEKMNRMIEFKSERKYYDLERWGFKSNTVREVDLNDDRFIELWKVSKHIDDAQNIIKIQTTDKTEWFARDITNVTFWKNLCIISWKHPDNKDEI